MVHTHTHASVCTRSRPWKSLILLSLLAVLTVIIFMTAKASGGVVNPSVALMLFIVGEISWIKAAGFAVVQVSGAACGALVASVIDIGYTYGSWDVNHAGPGCGPVEVDARHYAPIFAWEFLGTFVLVHPSRPPRSKRAECTCHH